MTSQWFRTGQAVKTDLVTKDGERIYDLDPLAAELWAIAGPDGLDPTTIWPDDLPTGCRWLSDDEWAESETDASAETTKQHCTG
jgi:hypothetical protein